MGLIYLFLYLPIVVMIVFSFNESKSRTLWTGFTFDWYKKLFTNDVVISALINTLIIAVLAAIISTVLGTLAAIGINNMNKYLRSFVMNATYLACNESGDRNRCFPDASVCISQYEAWHDHRVDLPYHVLSSLCHFKCYAKTPCRWIPISMRLRLDLGCNPLRAYWKVVLPEIMPGVVSGPFDGVYPCPWMILSSAILQPVRLPKPCQLQFLR